MNVELIRHTPDALDLLLLTKGVRLSAEVGDLSEEEKLDHLAYMRGILPTNMATSIIAKFNLRTLHDMALVRLCTRTQGEYQDVFRAMKEEVVKVHPWADDFIQVACVDSCSCVFPRYGRAECPVYHESMDHSGLREAIKDRWANVRYEAAPRAKGGKAQ